MVSTGLYQKSSDDGLPYFTVEQVIADLYNLKSKAESKPGRKPDQKKLEIDLKEIITRAQKADLYSGVVIEYQANILALINNLDDAIDRYGSLRKLEDAEYTVKALEQFCNLRIKNLANKITALNKKKRQDAGQ
ncbi:MAG: hypothetical protein IPL55_00235 [Saprospiraceae bacterium]|nr:hypothetical protein [Saprospiraceae bacterium]